MPFWIVDFGSACQVTIEKFQHVKHQKFRLSLLETGNFAHYKFGWLGQMSGFKFTFLEKQGFDFIGLSGPEAAIPSE